MILFDYGDTLAREPAPDFLRGWRAVFQYVEEDPDGATPEQAHLLVDSLWRRFSGSRSLSASRNGGFEIHQWRLLRTVFDVLGLKSVLPLGEIETILMDNACPVEPVPHTAALLAALDRLGIRTGVISNIGWSGQALVHRLTALFPGHQFEFILASSEYGIRKPDPLLFQIALKKARLPAGKVWFCGDNLQADIAGAQGAGLFPLWLGGGEEAGLDFPHLRAGDWRELLTALEAAFAEGMLW